MRILLGLVPILSLLSACGSSAPIDQTGPSSSETVAGLAAGDDGWFVARPDQRKCASPMCGGYFVKRVNASRTACLDGRARSECYVAALDWSATRLSDEQRSKLAASPVVLRASFVDAKSSVGSYANLRIAEAWSPAVTPDDEGGYPAISATLYRAYDNGTRCITWPCPSTTQEMLNAAQSRPVAGVDLADSCANDKQIAAAYEALATSTGVVVDGEDTWIHGPGGWMKELVGYNFYVRVEAATEYCAGFLGRSCSNPSDTCDISVANACHGADLPGICKPTPEMCMNVYSPVCGCDGTTYSNDCFRIKAHAQLDHEGACEKG